MVNQAFVRELDQVLLLGLSVFQAPAVDLGLLAWSIHARGVTIEVTDRLPELLLLLVGVEKCLVRLGYCLLDGVDLEVASSARAGRSDS